MRHRVCHLIIVIFTFILLAVTAFVNFFSWTGLAPDGWFKSSILAVYEKYYLEILPAAWTFQIWTFIFVYQFIWGTYTLSLLCRKTNDWSGYLYYRPNFMPIALYLFYMINLLLDIAWVFTFDREMFTFAGPILLGISITLYICIGISYYSLNKHGAALLRMNHKRDVKLVRTLVQNGMSTYGTWVTVTSLINIGVLLVTQFGLSQKDASSICLGILAIEIIIYFVVDVFIIDKSSRYTMTPYIVLIYAIAGIIARTYNVGGRNFILSLIVLSVAAMSFILKIVITVWRNRTEPEPILRSRQTKPDPSVNNRAMVIY